MKKVFILAVYLAIAGIGFGWGFLSGTERVFPYDQLKSARLMLLGHSGPAALPPLDIDKTPEWPPVQVAAKISCAPAAAPITTDFGNNHDAVYLQGQPGDAFAHYLLISGDEGYGQLWGSDAPDAVPDAWTLVKRAYFVAPHYELDDSIAIDGTHYVFEEHSIYALAGDPATGSHSWTKVGRFPDHVDDVAVHFDGTTVHLFGEYGDFGDRPDGASIAYYTTPKDFSAWTLVNTAIANPNVFGEITWGVGDPSLVVIDGAVLMVTDIEADGVPYRIALWQAGRLGQTFDFAGILAAPAADEESLYSYRVQDGEFLRLDDRLLMFANWRNINGTLGSDLPAFPDGSTRVIGGYTCRLS